MPGEHVGKQTKRERYRTDQKVGRNFDGCQQDVSKGWDAGKKCDSLEVLQQTLSLDADCVEEKITKSCKDVRERYVGHRRELHERNDSENVVYQNKSKESKKKWHVSQKVMTDNFFAQIFAHKGVDRFAGKLQFTRNDGGFPRCQDKECRNQNYREENECNWFCRVLVVGNYGCQIKVCGARWDEARTDGLMADYLHCSHSPLANVG